MKSVIIKILFSVFIIWVSSCENNYNKMVDWADNIPIGTDIEQIKLDQPNFLIIDWQNPDTFKNLVLYEINIQRNNDILEMQNFLSFTGNKFQGRQPSK